MSVEEPGSMSLFGDVFQSTSAGDVGLQLGNGILFRCHSTVLAKAGGFLEKLRCHARRLPLKSSSKDLDHWDYALTLNRPHLLKDLKLLRFSKLPAEMNKGTKAHSERIYAVGATTASAIGGSTGATRRSDPYVLAERYELANIDYEHLVELLRFVYCGHLFYERLTVTSDQEKKDKVRLMRDMLLLADRFSIDTLYERCIAYFQKQCYSECGLMPFTDLFFQLEHYMTTITEPLFLRRLRQALVEMTCSPLQLRAVARDSRWCSLSFELLFQILDADRLAVVQESDVVGLIERWNAHADKTKDAVARLMATCRQVADSETAAGVAGNLRKSSIAMKYLPTAAHLNTKPPRNNIFSDEAHTAISDTPKTPTASKTSEEEETAEQVFTQVDGHSPIATGFSFYLGQGESILQKNALRSAGSYRLRASFKQTEAEVWPKDQEVFLGANFGPTKYFGYLISATQFQGIYRVAVVSGASDTLSQPVFITGSSSHVELDCELNIRVPKVNGVVQCTFVLFFNNINVGSDSFQLTETTMTEGPGLRYMVSSTGLDKDEQQTIYVQLSWLRGGSAEDSAKVS